VLTELLSAQRVPTRQRVVLAAICGLLAAMITLQKNSREPTPRDFEQVWFAARSLLGGAYPCSQIGPGMAFDWPFPLVYPLPAAVIALPLAPFPAHTATVIFSAITGVAFAWALMEYGYGPSFASTACPCARPSKRCSGRHTILTNPTRSECRPCPAACRLLETQSLWTLERLATESEGEQPDARATVEASPR
jgi:hypothetical protein